MKDNQSYKGITIGEFLKELSTKFRYRAQRALWNCYCEEVKEKYPRNIIPVADISSVDEIFNQDVSYLAKVSKKELLRKKNFGKRSLQELEDKLKQYKIKLSE